MKIYIFAKNSPKGGGWKFFIVQGADPKGGLHFLGGAGTPLWHYGSTFKGSYLLNNLLTLVLPENLFTSNFCDVEISKMLKIHKNWYFYNFWDHLAHSNPTVNIKSTFKCLYSLDCLYILVLLETVFISNFYEMEMYHKCPKVIYLLILTNFWPPYAL